MGCGGSKSGAYAPPNVENQVYGDALIATLPTMAGKVVVITGASSSIGLGWVCAKTLAMKGAKVVLLNRPSDRAKLAAAELRQAVPTADVVEIDCDLQVFESVRSAAAKITAQFADVGIDVLCCNAGVMALEDVATVDGCDVQMQSNHLSHFLLTRELMPLLETAANLRGEARVVNHSSGARFLGGHLEAKYFGKNGGNLGGNSNSMFFGGARWKRYGQSKLANAVFTQALRDKLAAKGSKVLAACAQPGLCATELQRTTDKAGGMGSGTWFMSYSQSPEDGSASLILCCAAEGIKSGDSYEPKSMGNTGSPTRFYPDKEIYSKDPKARALLWEESEKVVGPFPL